MKAIVFCYSGVTDWLLIIILNRKKKKTSYRRGQSNYKIQKNKQHSYFPHKSENGCYKLKIIFNRNKMFVYIYKTKHASHFSSCHFYLSFFVVFFLTNTYSNSQALHLFIHFPSVRIDQDIKQTSSIHLITYINLLFSLACTFYSATQMVESKEYRWRHEEQHSIYITTPECFPEPPSHKTLEGLSSHTKPYSSTQTSSGWLIEILHTLAIVF